MTTKIARKHAAKWLDEICTIRAKKMRVSSIYVLIMPPDNEQWLEGAIKDFRFALYSILKSANATFRPTISRVTDVCYAMGIPLPFEFSNKRKDFWPFIDAVLELLQQEFPEK